MDNRFVGWNGNHSFMVQAEPEKSVSDFTAPFGEVAATVTVQRAIYTVRRINHPRGYYNLFAAPEGMSDYEALTTIFGDAQ